LIKVQTPESLTKVVQATETEKHTPFRIWNRNYHFHKKASQWSFLWMEISFYNDPYFLIAFLEQIPSKTKIQLLLWQKNNWSRNMYLQYLLLKKSFKCYISTRPKIESAINFVFISI
jgi:hypothetical protein